MFRAMKPETAARKAAMRKAMRTARSADLRRRLHEKARAEGPGSIWAEMAADADAAAERRRAR